MNAESDLQFPEDLREWVDEPILVQMLGKCATACRQNGVADGEGTAVPQRSLLVMAFSYVTGCYFSEDIEESCYSVAALKMVCDGQDIPKAAELRAFRRSHHCQLHDLLCRVMGLASAKVRQGLDPDHLRQAVEAEAQRRLEAAMLADTSTLDV